ncbi:hypothetical protein AB0G04_37500 [Actinoplanes sp. NPDC023801]|uniref:hypothetical protein n=1 Tax=Actinoplanes sp. NPDC023801 TaxID=3154595 RepID=UPI00340670A8
MDVWASPATKIYHHHVNAWRRERFAGFPYRPGQPIPPAVQNPNGIVKNHLQVFFETAAEAEQERRALHLEWQRRQPGANLYTGLSTSDYVVPRIDSIPAFHRPQMVPLGNGECYDCDGTGWLLYVPGDVRQPQTLAERPCDACGGTGNWRQAEIRSGRPESYFHRIPPGFRGPDPGSPYPGTKPFEEHLGRHSPPVPEVRRRRGVPGIVRVLLGVPVFLLLADPVAQPLWAVTHRPGLTTLLALAVTAALVSALNRVVLGPLRDDQILGPLWVLILPYYLLFGALVLVSMPAESKWLGDLSVNVLLAAKAARERLSRIPLGR